MENNLVPSESVVTEDYINDDNPIVMKDAPKDGVDEKAIGIIPYVEEKFQESKTKRFSDEQRWINAYRNYRGLYGPDTQFTSSEKSKIFVKITKAKVLAAYGQICDILFGSDKFPIDVKPTPKPEGIAESVNFEVKDPSQPSTPESLPKLEPGETRASLEERLGSQKNKLEPVIDRVQEGPGTTPKHITVHPAALAAEKMKKTMDDQLEEAGARTSLRFSVFETALFGNGIMKGPYGLDKEYPYWDEEGNYSPEIKMIPYFDHVSIWNSYPDPNADNMDQCEYFVQRHKLSRSKLRALKKRTSFRSNSIDRAIAYGENYVSEWWESHLEETIEEGGLSKERFEVLEFWGIVDTDVLEDHNIDIPKEAQELGEVNVNVWVCNGEVLRLVMNPYKPSRIPYFSVPYEVNPYSFFGIGVAENMEDTQLLMNGFMRMAVDNAALSGNLVFEVDKDNLQPGQDLSIFPGKVFIRQGGAPGQALFGTKFPNTANENMQLFDKARQLADEQTGIPSFSHGQTGVTGIGRTSSGISMLMGAASGSIKTVVKNIDDYLLGPLGKSLFRFNMQFNFDPEIRGDLEVKARGTEAYIATEIRSQRLMQFLQTTQNPQDAPFARRDYILREIAKSLELDPDKVVNNPADAAIQAEMLAKMMAAMTPPEPANAPQGAGQGVPEVSDPTGTGGGNIGVGMSPVPGEAGFTGNPQEQQQPETSASVNQTLMQ